jgi:hypothetical protein
VFGRAKGKVDRKFLDLVLVLVFVLLIFFNFHPVKVSANSCGVSVGIFAGGSKGTKEQFPMESVGWAPFVGGLTEVRFQEFLIELSLGYARKTYMPNYRYIVDITNYNSRDELHYTNYFSHLSSKFHPFPLPIPFFIYAGGGIGVSFIWNEALLFHEPPKLFYSKVLDIYPLIGITYMFQKPTLKIFVETRYVYHLLGKDMIYTYKEESLFIISGVSYEFGRKTKDDGGAK